MSIIEHFGLNFLLVFIFLVMTNFALRKIDNSQNYLVLSDYMNILLQAIICSFVYSLDNALFNVLLLLVVVMLYGVQIGNVLCKQHYGFKISLHLCKVSATKPSQKNVLLLLCQNLNLLLISIFMLTGFVIFLLFPMLWFKYFLAVNLVFTLHMLTGGEWRLNRLVSWLVMLIPLLILIHRYVIPGLHQFPIEVFNRVGSGLIAVLIVLYIWHFFSRAHFFTEASLLREQFREEANKNPS